MTWQQLTPRASSSRALEVARSPAGGRRVVSPQMASGDEAGVLRGRLPAARGFVVEYPVRAQLPRLARAGSG